MPEQPGSFLKFAHVIGNRAVTEFSYRYADNQKACIFVGVRTANEAEKAEIIADLTKNGFDVEDMSDDDIAKTHVRYLWVDEFLIIMNDFIALNFQNKKARYLNS